MSSDPMRIRDKRDDRLFVAMDDQLFTDRNGDGQIEANERLGPSERPDVRAAVRRFGKRRPHPRARAGEHFEAAGIINTREQAALRSGGKILAKRPDLWAHLDFFDVNRDGRIALGENYNQWSALGENWLRAGFQSVGSVAVFGDGPPWRRGIDISAIQERRPKNATGVYGPDGNVDQARLDQYLAAFDARATDGEMSHDDFRAFSDAMGPLGSIPKKQFESLLRLTARLNGSETITREQIEKLYDNSLFYEAVEQLRNR